MLHISLSTQRNRHLDQLFDTVCKNALQLNERQMIIVPEQFSHSLERSLCKVGGDSISRYAEILGFSRLAVRVFSEFGGVAETETDADGNPKVEIKQYYVSNDCLKVVEAATEAPTEAPAN